MEMLTVRVYPARPDSPLHSERCLHTCWSLSVLCAHLDRPVRPSVLPSFHPAVVVGRRLDFHPSLPRPPSFLFLCR